MSSAQQTKKKIKTGGDTGIMGSAWRWFQKATILIIFSLVVNHLATPDSFPGNASYRFPVEGFLSTILLCILIAIIAEVNFRYYRKTHFSKKVEITSIAWFMLSTLGFITLMYIPLGIVLNLIAGGDTEFYYLLIGLLLTLLVSFILIGLSYMQDLYNLYKLSVKDAEITIESGAKLTKLTYEHIACFYIENKIVYTVKQDGTSINTDFTLNELEERINDQLFFRATRQIIIHRDAVDQIEKIENGKLRIRLKATIENDSIPEIRISRYKRKEFLNWFQ